MNKLVVALMLLAFPVRAEVASITLAKQFGIAYLPFMIIEEDHLIEKHAAALGVRDFRVEWTFVTSGAVANDGLLSGRLAFGVGAIPAMLVLWDKTRTSSNPVLALTGVAVMPTQLNTRNPAIHGVADFTDKDRIAVPGVKVSNHAVVLEIAAARAFGADGWNRLDPLTVALGAPDAAAQIMSPNGQVDSHFASPPYSTYELRGPGVHAVLNSVDVMGDTSLTLLWTTQRFASANPHVTQAVFDAVAEALGIINQDKAAAAERYLRLSGDKIGRDDLAAVIADPHLQFTATPLGVMAFATFMKSTGSLRALPAQWSDFFLPIAHALPGN